MLQWELGSMQITLQHLITGESLCFQTSSVNHSPHGPSCLYLQSLFMKSPPQYRSNTFSHWSRGDNMGVQGDQADDNSEKTEPG